MKLSLRKMRDLSFLSICLMVFALGVWWVRPTQPSQVRLRISAGNQAGTRHALALQLRDICQAHNIQLEVIPSEGSEKALEDVHQGKIELALVQGGLIDTRYPHVTQVAPLHLEPLHLLVKSHISEQIKQHGLVALGGCVINTGSTGSGTRSLATMLLRFLGLHAATSEATASQSSPADPAAPSSTQWPSHYRESLLSYDTMVAAKTSDELPDAIFSISSLPSTFAKIMVERHNFELVELPFSDAFALDAFDFAGLGIEGEWPKGLKSFDQSRVFPVTIPAFTYSVRQRQPDKPLTTIGTRLLLVAHDQVPAAVVERLLEALFSSVMTKNARPPVELSVMDNAPEFAWHPGAKNFSAHHRPLIAGAFVELTANGLAIVGSVLGGTFFLIQWLRSRRQNKNEVEFRNYLTAVLEVERQLLDCDLHASVPVGRLVKLHQRLVELKQEVANRFFSGELEGQRLMLGFMTLANDVRNHIARLIMHERDNVEEIASQADQNIETLWTDRIETPTNQALGPTKE